MAQVTYANIFSEARNNIVSLISNTANVPDPNVSSAEFRKWIYARDPDVKASDFTGYPYIIIHSSDFEVGEKGSKDGKSKPASWSIEIEVVTSDRGWGGKSGQGQSNMDTISNNIVKTLLNEANRKTLRGYGMCFCRPDSTPVTLEPQAEELVFRRSIMVGFETRLRVSA